MAMKHDVRYQKYALFFAEMGNLHSPWALASFEAALVKQLVPFAPYMLKVLRLIYFPP